MVLVGFRDGWMDEWDGLAWTGWMDGCIDILPLVSLSSFLFHTLWTASGSILRFKNHFFRESEAGRIGAHNYNSYYGYD